MKASSHCSKEKRPDLLTQLPLRRPRDSGTRPACLLPQRQDRATPISVDLGRLQEILELARRQNEGGPGGPGGLRRPGLVEAFLFDEGLDRVDIGAHDSSQIFVFLSRSVIGDGDQCFVDAGISSM